MMEDTRPQPAAFPAYHPPAGIPIADRKQTSLLVKAMNTLVKSPKRAHSQRKGLTSRQTVRIGKRKTKFY